MRIAALALVIIPVLGLMSYAAKAKGPAENISPERHPNLAAAQELLGQAADKITAAQQANEFDLGGHAKKAKQLIDEASRELKQAAVASNEKKK